MKDYRLDGGVVSYPDNLPTVAPLFGPRFESLWANQKEGDELTQDHMDLAASVQRHCEHVIFHTLTRLHELTGLDASALQGGLHKTVWPTAKSRGIRLSRRCTSRLRVMMRAFPWGLPSITSMPTWVLRGWLRLRRAHTGCRFTNEEVEAFLQAEGVEYIRYASDEELYDVVSDALVDGKVIGWFNGRAEFGPRALGWAQHHRWTRAVPMPRSC